MAKIDSWFDEAFVTSPVMAILRGFTPERTVALAQLAWDLGISCVEVPIQSPSAVSALEATVAAAAVEGRPVGAGTIVTADLVRQAADAGAVFTVSPGFDADVASASAAAGLAHLPGVASASDIQRAVAMGLGWVKAFPATSLGEDWFKAMQGPFPDVRFVATGGISAQNAGQYLRAGASVVAVGSALEDHDQLKLLAETMRDFRASAI